MAAGSSSCSCHMAGAFPGLTKEELLKRMENVWDKFSHNFPHFDVNRFWEITLLHKGYFTHYSLLFTVSGSPGCREGLLIHLIIVEGNRMSLDFFMVDPSVIKKKALKTESLGVTPKPMRADTIIRGAHDVLKSMGSYNSALNNCQDYCQIVAKCLGVSVPSTGANAVVLGVAGSAVVGGIGYGIYQICKRFFSGDDDKEDDDKGRRKK